jgi:hypothetical protein
MTQPGLGYWLGHPIDPQFVKGATITTAEELTGEIRSFTVGSPPAQITPPPFRFVSSPPEPAQPSASTMNASTMPPTVNPCSATGLTSSTTSPI